MHSLLKTINKTFRNVHYSQKTKEARFPCPVCAHSAFYFSLSKLVGYCHSAKCNWKPTLKDLQPYLRRLSISSLESPDLGGLPSPSPTKIFLPSEAQRLIRLESGEYCTRYRKAVEEIQKRGVSIEKQFQFDLHISDDRIYIPVYENNKLVNYVARLIWWLPFEDKRKYLYCSGVKTSEYLFNWDIAKKWERLTLVENSFNAMYLQELAITTNFGSHLSATQIEKIAKGKAKSVFILWDQGAEKNAEKAVASLGEFGIPASYARIAGQPDNYSLEQIKSFINHV